MAEPEYKPWLKNPYPYHYDSWSQVGIHNFLMEGASIYLSLVPSASNTEPGNILGACKYS